MTATVEVLLPLGAVGQGFVLNNEMTDFARAVPDSGEHPNAVAPNRRP